MESLSGLEWDAGQLGSLNLPVSIRAGLRLTPEQFAVLCGAIPDAVLELAADGSLIYMTSTGGDMGARHTNSVRRKATKFITNPTCLDMPCRITVQGLKGPSFQGTEERTNKSLPGSGKEGSFGSMVGGHSARYWNQPESSQRMQFRNCRCICPQASVVAPTDLHRLMRFLSLRLVPKAARAPRMGRGPGTSLVSNRENRKRRVS